MRGGCASGSFSMEEEEGRAGDAKAELGLVPEGFKKKKQTRTGGSESRSPLVNGRSRERKGCGEPQANRNTRGEGQRRG